MQPLLDAAERWTVRPAHVLRTHADPDHVAHEAELGVEVITGPWRSAACGSRRSRPQGHSEDHLAFVVNGELCFSGDVLFKDAVGEAATSAPIRGSVMDVIMKLPPETRVLPGHTDETTIGREWEENPFVRFWRGLDSPSRSPAKSGARRLRSSSTRPITTARASSSSASAARRSSAVPASCGLAKTSFSIQDRVLPAC